MFKEKYLLIRKTKSIWKINILLMFHILSVFISLSLTFFMRMVIDSLSSFQEGTFHYLIVILSLILLAQMIVSFCLKRLEVKTQLHMEKSLKNMFFESVMNHDDIFLKKYHTQELLQRCHQDIMVISEGIVCFFPRTMGIIIKIIFILLTLQVWEPRLLLMIVIGVVVISIISLFIYGYINRLSHQVIKALETAQAFLQETFNSLLLVHSFGSSQSLSQVNSKNIDCYNQAYMKKFYYIQMCMFLLRGLLSIIYMIGFIWCGQKVLTHQISLGTLIAMMSLISQLQMPIVQLSNIYGKLTSQNASLERLLEFPVLGSYQKHYDYQKINQLYQDFQYLELKNVSFSYDDKPLLSQIHMRFDKNTITGINGVSGKGKTTLLKLLMNIYPCQEGTIEFHGENQSLSLEQIGIGMMGYIPMDSQLLYGTIRQIITFYAEEIDEKRLTDVCQKACVDEFLCDLPCGLDTLLTKQNMPLSQGQLQRISIARALYSQTKILLLDEATSGLDEALEAKILNNLKDKTIIIVSHRPSIRKVCNQFYELKET